MAAVSLTACGNGTNSAQRSVKTRTNAVPIAAVHTPVKTKALDPAASDRMFNLADAFESVAYQLSFSADARNPTALTTACAAFLNTHKQVEQSLAGLTGDAGDLGARMLQTAASATNACQNPAAVSDDVAEAVQLDFGAFREMTFDFSQLVSG
jgi:hypothetical protein